MRRGGHIFRHSFTGTIPNAKIQCVIFQYFASLFQWFEIRTRGIRHFIESLALQLERIAQPGEKAVPAALPYLYPCCRRERRVTGFRKQSKIAWYCYKYWHCAKTVESVLGWFFPYLGQFLRENHPKHHPIIKPWNIRRTASRCPSVSCI